MRIGIPTEVKVHEYRVAATPEGVRELTLQKRDAPELYRQFKRPEGALVYAWRRDGDWILGGERLEQTDL